MNETFDLKVNNDPLNTLKYLDSGFSLSMDQVSVFRADTRINRQDITKSKYGFEHLPGVLTHKILD